MDQLIVYGSQYGTTQRYAEQFSQLTRLPCISSEEVKDLSPYGRVIHFGGLYAGGVKGLRKTIRALGEHTGLVIVTVGLADVTDEENLANIRNALRRQVPGHLLEKTQVFHLRGGIDYRKLSLKHKAMMTLLYHSVKNLPEERKTAETRAMIETFNKAVDFVDFSALEPIVEAVRYDDVEPLDAGQEREGMATRPLGNRGGGRGNKP